LEHVKPRTDYSAHMLIRAPFTGEVLDRWSAAAMKPSPLRRPSTP